MKIKNLYSVYNSTSKFYNTTLILYETSEFTFYKISVLIICQSF